MDQWALYQSCMNNAAMEECTDPTGVEIQQLNVVTLQFGTYIHLQFPLVNKRNTAIYT